MRQTGWLPRHHRFAGTHALPRIRQNPNLVMNPVKIAEAFYYLHSQDRSCWTHELQLTPFSTRPSYRWRGCVKFRLVIP
jgi:hypothetical protein